MDDMTREVSVIRDGLPILIKQLFVCSILGHNWQPLEPVGQACARCGKDKPA